MYYVKSGTFSNAIYVQSFQTKSARSAWVDDEPMNGTCHHSEQHRTAITRREADSILAGNRRQVRNHQRNAGYVQNFGTTELIDCERRTIC